MVPIPKGLLRPDVAAIVAAAIADCRSLAGTEFQLAARAFKRRLSQACGWHATTQMFDQGAYDRAVAAFYGGAADERHHHRGACGAN